MRAKEFLSENDDAIIQHDRGNARERAGIDDYLQQSKPMLIATARVASMLNKHRLNHRSEEDQERIEKIKQKLKSGAKQLPVWVYDGEVYEGIHRTLAALELKLPTIPVIFLRHKYDMPLARINSSS